MSIGGNSSEQQSTSFGEATSNSFDNSGSSTFVDPNQSGFLNNMRQGAMNQFNQGNDQLTGLGNQLTQGGMGALTQLGKTGDVSGFMNAQLGGLQSGLTDIWNQGNIRIGDNAEASGAFGGGRHGIAEANLGGEIGKAYTQGYGDIMSNANAQSMQANNSILAGLPQVFNMGLNSQFGGLGALQGLLGDPTILQNAFSQGGSSSYGYDTSQSSGEKMGFGFGFS